MNRFCFFIASLLLLLIPYMGFAQTGDPLPTNVEIKRSRIRILTIGIGLYDEGLGLNNLISAQDLSKYGENDSIAYKYIFPSYTSNENEVVPLNGRISKDKIEDALYKFAQNTNEQDVVIIHILGHGVVDDGDYCLVCSDGKKIPGRYIRDQIYKMTDKDALVIIFLDTCHAGVLFVGHEPNNNRLKGAIAFYPSSKPEQSSVEIERETLFSQKIFDTFSHKNKLAFDIGTSPKYMSLGGMEKVIKIAFDKKTDQTPEPMYFAKKGKLDNCNIKYYPIIDEEKIEMGGRASRKIPFYVGPSFGINTNGTLYSNVNFGVDINRWKVEVGGSIAINTSDEVLIYNSNGMMTNAFNYRGYNIYGRLGYNVAKKDSRWEVVPLAGISGNFIIGSHIKGLNNSIGETAGSLMLPLNFRVTYDLCKNNKHNFLLHGTVGCDIPLYKDDNVKVLKENEYVKNWCSFRPYLEVGLMIKLYNF